MVQTCNKIMNKALQNSKDFFFPLKLCCSLWGFFSYLQRVLFQSPFKRKDIKVFMYSCQESISVIKGPCFEVVKVP